MGAVLRDERGEEIHDPEDATISQWLRDVAGERREFLIMEYSEPDRFAQCNGDDFEYGEDGRVYRYGGDWTNWFKLLLDFANGARLPIADPVNWKDVSDEINETPERSRLQALLHDPLYRGLRCYALIIGGIIVLTWLLMLLT